MHGWAGRSTQLLLLLIDLLEKGFMVVSFDGLLMANLQNEPCPDFFETIRKVDQTYGPFEAGIGHSFGGMCLYNAVATFFKSAYSGYDWLWRLCVRYYSEFC